MFDAVGIDLLIQHGKTENAPREKSLPNRFPHRSSCSLCSKREYAEASVIYYATVRRLQSHLDFHLISVES